MVVSALHFANVPWKANIQRKKGVQEFPPFTAGCPSMFTLSRTHEIILWKIPGGGSTGESRTIRVLPHSTSQLHQQALQETKEAKNKNSQRKDTKGLWRNVEIKS